MGLAGRLSWYKNRLACMSAGEVAWRVKEQALGQIERRGLLVPTRAPAPDLAGRPAQKLLGNAVDVDVARYRQAADRVLEGRIALFAYEDLALGPIPVWNRDPSTGRTAPLAFGRAIDYRDADSVGNIKYLWELNRHLQFVTVAQAYRLTGEVRYLEGIGRLLKSWLDQCPYPQGPNWSSGLELAIRLINWSMVWQLIGGRDAPLFAGAAGDELRRRWLDAVFQHAHFIRRHLSRYSSANNHLIGEAAGLFTAWMTWPHWKDMEEWGRRGFTILADEALRQNGGDGVNREQAVSYQQFVLDFLIISGLLGRANGHHFPQAYWHRVEAMLEFIASIMDAGGNMPMIGDADDGYVVRLSQEPRFCPYRSLLATGAVLFKRGDFKAKTGWLDDKTRWLLGAEADKFYAMEPDAGRLPVRRTFPEGGYYILGGDFETDDEVRMIVDAGPLGYQSIAAHGHADALSVTLSVGGLEFLVDPGTYAYHTERRWRDYFRGTAAHNTARIDGQDQSVIGGSFLWLRHARAWCEEWASSAQEDCFRGAHDGYMRLHDPVLHQREVRYDKAHRLVSVTDTFACKGVHDVELFWHFSEECAVRCVDGRILARRGDRQIVIRPVEGVSAVAMAKGDATLPAGWISRRFDVKAPTATVIWRARTSGPAVLRTEIDCSMQGVHDNANSGGAQLERYN